MLGDAIASKKIIWQPEQRWEANEGSCFCSSLPDHHHEDHDVDDDDDDEDYDDDDDDEDQFGPGVFDEDNNH